MGKRNKYTIPIIIGICFLVLIIIGIIFYYKKDDQKIIVPVTTTNNISTLENFFETDRNVKQYNGDSLSTSFSIDRNLRIKGIKLITSGNLASDSAHTGYVIIYKNRNPINKQSDSTFTSPNMKEISIPLNNIDPADLLFKPGDNLMLKWDVKTGTSTNNSFYVYQSKIDNSYILPVIIYFESL